MKNVALYLTAALCLLAQISRAEFRAGAYVQDISPQHFPVPVNGNLKATMAEEVHDPMNARCLALQSGNKEFVFCVVDACMIPREICEKAKALSAAKTGIDKSCILISATHTHSAAALTPVFQCDPDPAYVAEVPSLIAEGIVQAHENLERAEFACASASDPVDVFNRRWLLRPGQTYENPFGELTDRAWMNPGFTNAKVSTPAGPVDQEVAILAIRSALQDKRPIAILANYSLHYVGGYPAISADYYGAFAEALASKLRVTDQRYIGRPPFVGILSNGTSGNINNVDFGSPLRHKQNPGAQIQLVAGRVADAAVDAFNSIQKWDPAPMMDHLEQDLSLGVRKANSAELNHARYVVTNTPKDKDDQWSNRDAVYAREALLLDAYPNEMPVKLQMYRIGDLSIASIPCEVFVETGLSLKRLSPFGRHFTISLANGYNGYLPTPDQHLLGGYETWRARSSYLEVNASVKIVDYFKSMFAQLKQHSP